MAKKVEVEEKVVEAVEAVEAAPVVSDVPAGWVKVRALERLAGGDKIVDKGEEYWQPPEAAEFMARQGWVEIVAPAAEEPGA